MSKIPKDPKEIFDEIVNDYKALFGEDLVSIVLYGSAASGDYIPGRSDINFMIVLAEDRIRALEEALEIVSKWRKRDVAVPLFVTEEYIRTSLDVFPIEYLNFQKNYIQVFGKDILKDITFDEKLLRLQCEREIKGKLLLLRSAFLDSKGKGKRLEEIVRQSLGAFLAIFDALLYLKGKPIPQRRRELVRDVCELFDIDRALFEKLLDVKQKKIKLGKEETISLFKSYMTEIDQLAKIIDKIYQEEK